jgi:cytochrome b-561
VYAVLKYHVQSGIPNLYSLHSWLGVATVSLYALQWAAGFLAFFFPDASPATRCSAMPRHAIASLLVFALVVATAQLGFLEKLTFLQGPPLRLPKYSAKVLLVNFTALVVLLLGTRTPPAPPSSRTATRPTSSPPRASIPVSSATLPLATTAAKLPFLSRQAAQSHAWKRLTRQSPHTARRWGGGRRGPVDPE